MPRNHYAAFISYTKRDRTQAKRVAAELETRGLRTWIDLTGIEVGDQLSETVKQAISSSACVVVYLSEFSNRSAWVLQEVEWAVAKAKPVYFVARRNVEPSSRFPSVVQDTVRINAGAGFTQSAAKSLVSRVYATDRGKIPVVSVLNMKGGVGKTTLSYHLFGCLNDVRKVGTLLIDLDPQHNLTQLMVPTSKIESLWDSGKSVLSVFEPSRAASSRGATMNSIREIDPSGKVPEVEGLHLALNPPSAQRPRFDIVIGNFELVKVNLVRDPNVQDKLLQNFVDFIEGARRSYQLIVIDLNPGASFLTEAALRASSHILAPVRPDRYSARGLQLLDTLMDSALRISAPPERLAIINGYRRQVGNQSLAESEDGIERALRGGRWRVLKSKLGLSDTLVARQQVPYGGVDLTADLAHRNPNPFARQIRLEMIAASKALAEELGV